MPLENEDCDGCKVWRNELWTPPPMGVTTARLCDQFEADGTVQTVLIFLWSDCHKYCLFNNTGGQHEHFVFWWRLFLSTGQCTGPLPHQSEKLSQRSFLHKMDRMKKDIGVSTLISWLNTFTLLLVRYSRALCMPQNQEHRRTRGLTIKLSVLLSHQQHYKHTALCSTLLSVVS